MSELPISVKRKIIKYEFKQFNQENGFKFVTPNILLREKNSILQFVSFGIRPGWTYGDIAVQPLYVPAENLNLCISIRIQFLGEQTRKHWGASGKTEEDFSLDVKDMLQLISNGGMMWFEAMESPENLIKTTLNKNFKLTQGYYPAKRLETVAFSHLYLGHIDESIKYFNELVDLYSSYADTNPYAQDFIDKYQYWIDLAQTNPEELPHKFESIISQTCTNLKIKL